MESNGFEHLDVFQRAYRVSLEIHRDSLKFPQVEQYGLADQMRRASKSIPANLAEGYARRNSQAEFNRYIRIAIGSADEMRVWLRYCFDLKYINQQNWHAWKSEYIEIAKMLNGLSRSVLKSDV